jgi:hypothetical protein
VIVFFDIRRLAMTQRTTRRLSIVILGALMPWIVLARPAGAAEPPPRYPFGIETRGLMTWLLTRPSLREELKVTPDQFTAIKEQAIAIANDLQMARGQAWANGQSSRHNHHVQPPFPFAADAMQINEWWAGSADAALKKILSAGQFKRIQQIQRQRTTPLYGVLYAAMGKEKFSPSTALKYQELEKLRSTLGSCLRAEREFAFRKLVPYREVERLVREKQRQLDAAYYTRLLTLLTREQKQRWAEHIGAFSRARGDEAEIEQNFEELYFALLVSQDGTVELPFDPYLVLPGGETTGQDYAEYPRGQVGTR